jgi:biopolymer transport protein ExbB/TolQ
MVFGVREALRVKALFRRYRNTRWFEFAITAAIVLLSTSIYSLFYSSELRLKVAHLTIERDEIIKHKNSELNSVVQQLKGSINHIRELETDFGSVKVKLKDFVIENEVVKSKLLVERARLEEHVLISSTKDRRLG